MAQFGVHRNLNADSRSGIPKQKMGALVADLSVRRDQIIAALDLLVSGI